MSTHCEEQGTQGPVVTEMGKKSKKEEIHGYRKPTDFAVEQKPNTTL